MPQADQTTQHYLTRISQTGGFLALTFGMGFPILDLWIFHGVPSFANIEVTYGDNFPSRFRI